MQGLGNDFVVFDGVSRQVDLSSEQLRWIAHRHFGVGCDQVLIVERAERPDVDFRFRIYNADGSEAEQCGNGARCIARFARDRGTGPQLPSSPSDPDREIGSRSSDRSSGGDLRVSVSRGRPLAGRLQLTG